MFMGEYNHTIDAKSRLIIPSKFRESLGDDFVVTKGLDGCLFVFDHTEWTAFEEKLKALPSLTNPDVRKFIRFFMAGASEVEVDKQGRILIPANLKDFAALEKDVVLIGAGSRVEIWSKERYEGTVSYDDMEEIAMHMSELGLGI
ncbi:MAG: division/cell wall cluster transcriptional repressor MraZ [Lachnospiraceae bacterium]|nr:division/cell wall cluster transcriptional repressor MraZ [Lachnospiraceae bacterium]